MLTSLRNCETRDSEIPASKSRNCELQIMKVNHTCPKVSATLRQRVPDSHFDDSRPHLQINKSAARQGRGERTQNLVDDFDFCAPKAPFSDSVANRTLDKPSKDDDSLSSSSGMSDYSRNSSNSSSTRSRRRKKSSKKNRR